MGFIVGVLPELRGDESVGGSGNDFPLVVWWGELGEGSSHLFYYLYLLILLCTG